MNSKQEAILEAIDYLRIHDYAKAELWIDSLLCCLDDPQFLRPVMSALLERECKTIQATMKEQARNI